MVKTAFEKPVEGLAYLTHADGRNGQIVLNVVADGALYKFNISTSATARLNSECADAVRRHIHTPQEN